MEPGAWGLTILLFGIACARSLDTLIEVSSLITLSLLVVNARNRLVKLENQKINSLSSPIRRNSNIACARMNIMPI